MSGPYLREHSTREAPQHEPMRADQVPNAAGGYAWEVDDLGKLRRFLILGAEGGTYYIGQRELVRSNMAALERLLAAGRGVEAVAEIAAVSEGGRAKDNDPALFALAMCAKLGNEPTKRAANEALPRVARTGTHILHYAAFVEQFGGWGQGSMRAVRRWFERDVSDVAYHAVKYRRRDDWTLRDLLRLTHPGGSRSRPGKRATPAQRYLYDFICGRSRLGEYPDELRVLEGFERAQSSGSPAETATLVRDYELPREALKTEHLNDHEVWDALLERMPVGAMTRQLARMTASGFLKPMSEAERTVVERLGDGERIRRARLHPVSVLAALATYSQGRGQRGSLEWTPSQAVADALDGAFYLAFGNVEPANKRTLLALDVSGSMTHHEIAGVPGLTPRAGAAAMALVTAATEPTYHAIAFAGPYSEDRSGWGRSTASQADGPVPFPLSARERLDDVARRMYETPFGSTDASVPMEYATREGLDVDTFVVYTDNETWSGRQHPAQALRAYRERSGIAARLVVVGMVANEVSIADPDDAGMLDVVGFDTAAPELISAFSRGDV